MSWSDSIGVAGLDLELAARVAVQRPVVEGDHADALELPDQAGHALRLAVVADLDVDLADRAVAADLDVTMSPISPRPSAIVPQTLASCPETWGWSSR